MIEVLEHRGGPEAQRTEEELRREVRFTNFEGNAPTAIGRELRDELVYHPRADAQTAVRTEHGEVEHVELRAMKLVNHEGDDRVGHFGHHADAVALPEAVREILFGPWKLERLSFDGHHFLHVAPDHPANMHTQRISLKGGHAVGLRLNECCCPYPRRYARAAVANRSTALVARQGDSSSAPGSFFRADFRPKAHLTLCCHRFYSPAPSGASASLSPGRPRGSLRNDLAMPRTHNHIPWPKPSRACARHACGLLLLAAGTALSGCAGPAIRSQSPEIEALAHLEESTKLVGDYTTPWGLGAKRIERAALITGLADTGSDPPPGPQRAAIMADMQSRGVVEPNRLLASTTTSLAWVHGYLPPGCRKGDRFDVFVEVPPNDDTTSLDGGWLMQTRLAEMAVIANVIRDGHELGVTQGPLLVDPVSSGTLDSKAKLRARLPGGGIALTGRDLGLVIAPEHRSFTMSKRVGDWINRRFHAVLHGAKRGVATPKTDRYIHLEVPPVYRHNLARYVRVVQSVAVIEPPEGRHARLQLLARQLTDPVTAPAAAIRLEAIGKDAIPVLRKGLEAKDAEVRFAAAEALAYLGESVAASHLAEAAANLRSTRHDALAALGVLDDANGIDALQGLLANRSAETRYGAFRALRRIDPAIPLIRGDLLGEACSLHVVDVPGPPLVHAARSQRPEIVLFGTTHPLGRGLRAEAGRSIVVVVDGPTAQVSRFMPGEPDRQKDVPADVASVVRSIVDLGGGYPAVIQFLQQATASRHLTSRLAFDAVPDSFDGRPAIREETATSDDTTAAATEGRPGDDRS